MLLLPQAGFRRARPRRRGAALMMAFFVLVILIVLLHQISFTTKSDARVQRNEEALRMMDETAESILLQIYEDLAADGEADAASGDGAAGLGGGLGAAPPSDLGEVTGDDAAGGGGGPNDSKEDEWARPQRTELNDLRVRILIQDENSKFNLLGILSGDEIEAEEALDRLERVLINARKGTPFEIDAGTAGTMADKIRRFLVRRTDTELPKPDLLTADEDLDDMAIPLTLRQLCAAYPETFFPSHFRDWRDENGDAVHSLGSFITVHSSISTLEDLEDSDGVEVPTAPTSNDDGDDSDDSDDDSDTGDGEEGDEAPATAAGGGDGGSNGGRININTAPIAVLQAIVEDRDLPYGFWQQVVEYRNTEREDVEENEDPPLDEFGEEIVVKQVFSSVDDLNQIDDWVDVLPETEEKLRSMLDVQSEVFSIYVTVRKPTGIGADGRTAATKEDLLMEEEAGQGLVRTIRSVVWRRVSESGEAEIVPIVRWEELDYVPIEVLDYPDDDPYSRR